MGDNGGCTSVPTGISDMPKAWRGHGQQVESIFF